MRIDVVLMDFLKQEGLAFSRTALQKMILAGKVSLMDTHAATAREGIRSNYKVKAGEKIRVVVEEEPATSLSPENIPLEIIYEDVDLAVINKPAGLVVHPAPGNAEHTLVNALLYHIKVLSSVNPNRPGIVHRLDKGTSGTLVIAKNNAAHQSLAKQFAEHSIKRVYVALVEGKVEFNEDVIELPIGRHPYKRKSMSVTFREGARSAKTRYRTLARSDDFSVLELEPFTGRTHQLRVHLAFLGHPILGDATYGKEKKFLRLALHAKTIGFLHPAQQKFMEFSSPVPQEFIDFLEKLGVRGIF